MASSLAVELALHTVQALLPDLAATEPAGQAWQALVAEVTAGLNLPAGHLVQPVTPVTDDTSVAW